MAATVMMACCECGASIRANPVATCAACLQARYDVTADVQKSVVIVQCQRCRRWQKDDQGWVRGEPESKELLSYCLRRVGGLKQVRLVDASFVWTEPHSRRVKVKARVQSEVVKGVVLESSCTIEFIVQPKMCLDCHRSEASLTWNAVVQVRQKVSHKRTFLFLEQLILKHRAHERTLRIEAQPEGVDFFFASKSDGARFASFLDSAVPVRTKQSEKLITADVKSNNSTYHFTYMVEVAPICKDDLVVLPPRLAASHGNMPRLALCLNVGSTMRFIDPSSCRMCEVTSVAYWQHAFQPVLEARRLSVYIVLDVRRVDAAAAASNGGGGGGGGEAKRRRRGASKGPAAGGPPGAKLSTKHGLCEVEVAREKDLGANDERFTVLSHLGYILRAGDECLGYDLTRSNYNHEQADALDELPPVVLVRKHYPKWSQKAHATREWKLKSMVVDLPDEAGFGVGVQRDDGDLEMFMRDLTEDDEMRAKVNLYKRAASASSGAAAAAAAAADVEEDAPRVPLDELLEDLQALGLGGDDDDHDGGEGGDDDEDDDESL